MNIITIAVEISNGSSSGYRNWQEPGIFYHTSAFGFQCILSYMTQIRPVVCSGDPHFQAWALDFSPCRDTYLQKLGLTSKFKEWNSRYLFTIMILEWVKRGTSMSVTHGAYYMYITMKSLKGNSGTRFKIISEERVKFYEQNSENLMKIGWKIKKLTLWSFTSFHKTFLDQSIWICKWASWWCHRLTTCHIFCTYNFEKFNILL